MYSLLCATAEGEYRFADIRPLGDKPQDYTHPLDVRKYEGRKDKDYEKK